MALQEEAGRAEEQEQKRKQRDERVVGDERRQVRSAVVEELVEDAERKTHPTVVALEPVQTSDDAHVQLLPGCRSAGPGSGVGRGENPSFTGRRSVRTSKRSAATERAVGAEDPQGAGRPVRPSGAAAGVLRR